MVSVIDSITEKVFIFNSHEDKEEFFDTWDRLVVQVDRFKKCEYDEKKKAYSKPCAVMYHVFSNEVDEYTSSIEKALSIAMEWFEHYGCVRIYKDTDWNERDGIFEDGDCIFALGDYPL